MKLYEYQAKRLFSRYGIDIPLGAVAKTAQAAADIFKKLELDTAVIKAQILAGSRGKAGGIKKVHSRIEAKEEAKKMLGMRLISRQTGEGGQIVRQVLVEEAVNIKQELYLAITIDRGSCLPVMLASSRGGIDIEEVASTEPSAIVKELIDPFVGILPFQIRRIIQEIVQGARCKVQGATFHNVVTALSNLFFDLDASLVEINPLVITHNGGLIAVDGKLNIDDNSLFRHANLTRMRAVFIEDPLEAQASKYGLSYVGLSGNIGCMVNGAGLAMATMDLIKSLGGEPANFLDVGGGADKERIKAAFEIILSDKGVKAILINIFGGIVKCDVIAEGILEAAKKIKVRQPLVVRLEGTNVEEGKNLLSKSGLNIVFANDMEEAAKKAVGLT